MLAELEMQTIFGVHNSSKDESLLSARWKGVDTIDLPSGGWLPSLTNVSMLLPAAGWLTNCWPLSDQPR